MTANRPLLGWTQQMVDDYYAPLGLKESLLSQIEEARLEGVSDDAIEWGVEQIVFAAKSNSRRHEKPWEHYMRRSVERRHLLNYLRGLMSAVESEG